MEQAIINDLIQRVEQNPDDIQARRQLAVEFMNSGYNEFALKELYYLLKSFPDDARLYYNVGIVLENLKSFDTQTKSQNKYLIDDAIDINQENNNTEILVVSKRKKKTFIENLKNFSKKYQDYLIASSIIATSYGN